MIDKEREKIDNQKKTKQNTKRRKDRQKKEIMPANTKIILHEVYEDDFSG